MDKQQRFLNLLFKPTQLKSVKFFELDRREKGYVRSGRTRRPSLSLSLEIKKSFPKRTHSVYELKKRIPPEEPITYIGM